MNHTMESLARIFNPYWLLLWLLLLGVAAIVDRHHEITYHGSPADMIEE